MTATTAISVPSLDDIDGLADDLRGIHPLLDAAVASLRQLAEAGLDADQTATLLTALGGAGHGGDPSVIDLIGALVARIGHPTANPAIDKLPEPRRTAVADCTSQFAFYLAEFTPSAHLAEASGQIAGV